MIRKLLSVVCCLFILVSCSQGPKSQKVRIAINPWPGYEFLYLASEKGFFAEHGLDIEIVELSSLADVQRVYIQGRVDAFGSTMIEVVQAAGITQQKLDVILVPDFSFGGDMIIGNASIDNMAGLRGKRVGAEVGSLGMFVLHSALVKHGLTLDDIQLVNVEQLDAEAQMKQGNIDAIVTYPPYSIAVNKLPGHKQIFDTTEIPEKVIDTITVRAGLIDNQKQWLEKFHAAWKQALDFTRNHQQEAYEMMAKREGVSVAEFTDALSGLTIVETSEQLKLLGSSQLRDNISDVCAVLKQSDSIQFSCDNINELINGAGKY
jgi:NitT/TauT family transport system substrate-binding protein